MITYTQALDIIARTVEPLAATTRGLDSLAHQATAASVAARMDVPPFANSAMDGYAVRSADTASATDAEPVRLALRGMIAAGDSAAPDLESGCAIEIMTGAPVPGACDAVIPVERVEKTSADGASAPEIVVRESIAAGWNIRRAGEDFRAGDSVVHGGQTIGPHVVMGMAATGSDEIATRPPPRVAIVTTGSELTDAGLPGQRGIIRDANGPYLRACLGHFGATLTVQDHAADSTEALAKALRDAHESADVVLTTGGVSVGQYDVVPDVIAELGGELLFHRVAIRPGKPLLLARFANASLLFGLPGNPVAVAACMRFFVMPAMRLLQGLPLERFHAARAVEDIRKKPGLRWFGKARVTVSGDAELQARLLPGQESFKINSLVKSNGWVIVGEDVETVLAGDLVEVAPLYPTEFLQ